MLRSALLAAAFLLPSVAMADKLVNPDGDSFIEIQGTPAVSMFDALNPVSPAQAQTPPAIVPRLAAEVPEMSSVSDDILRRQWDGYYFHVPGQE